MHYFDRRERERDKKVEQKQFNKKHSLVLKRNISNILIKILHNATMLINKIAFQNWAISFVKLEIRISGSQVCIVCVLTYVCKFLQICLWHSNLVFL